MPAALLEAEQACVKAEGTAHMRRCQKWVLAVVAVGYSVLVAMGCQSVALHLGCSVQQYTDSLRFLLRLEGEQPKFVYIQGVVTAVSMLYCTLCFVGGTAIVAVAALMCLPVRHEDMQEAVRLRAKQLSLYDASMEQDLPLLEQYLATLQAALAAGSAAAAALDSDTPIDRGPRGEGGACSGIPEGTPESMPEVTPEADSTCEADRMCAICLEPMKNAVAIVPCGHSFCALCLREHMLQPRRHTVRCPYQCEPPFLVIANRHLRALSGGPPVDTAVSPEHADPPDYDPRELLQHYRQKYTRLYAAFLRCSDQQDTPWLFCSIVDSAFVASYPKSQESPSVVVSIVARLSRQARTGYPYIYIYNI